MSGHLLGTVLAVLASLPVQEPEPPVFAADVALVTVDAVVLDGNGRPVAGLTRDDFELLDEGERREILSFEALAFEPRPESASPERGRVSTNLDVRRVPVVTVLWDSAHLSPLDAERVKAHLKPWTAARLRGGYHVVLASTDGRWHVADGPHDVERVLEVIESLRGGRLEADDSRYISDYESDRIVDGDVQITNLVFQRFVDEGECQRTPAILEVGTPLVGPDLRFSDSNDVRACLQSIRSRAESVARGARNRVRTTLRALEHLCDVLAVAPGRKTVVLVSQGFPLGLDTGEHFRAATEAAQRANAVVEYLDPAKLRLLPSFDVGRAGNPAPQDAPQRHDVFLANRAGARMVALDTGGRVLRTNDVAQGLYQIAREAGTHYLLGFAPAMDAERGRFRRLSLSVRGRGLRVRARRGYAVGSAPSRDPAKVVRRVLDAPFDLPGAPLRVAAWVQEPRSPSRSSVTLAVELAPPGTASPGGPASTRRVDLAVEVRGAGGRWSREVQITPPRRRVGADRGEQPSPVARLTFELPAGSYRARILARRPEGAGLAAVTHAFEVPEVDAWRLSTPVIWAPKGGGLRWAAPVLTPDRAFETRETLHGAFAVLGEAAPEGQRLSGSWFLRPTAGGMSARSGHLTLETFPGGPPSCRFALPLHGLAAGEYDLVLRVRNESADRELEVVEPLVLTEAAASRARGLTPSAGPGALDRPRPKPSDPELAGLLDRAGQYVVEYERRFANIVAEEKYTQRVDATRRGRVDLSGDRGRAGVAATETLHGARRTWQRVTRADLVFVRLHQDSLWTTFRDVFEVDGEEVRDRDARLERLFVEPATSRIERARQIMNESAAYNIGPVIRTINVPTFPLVFLHPTNQDRFTFRREGRRQIAGVEGVEVRFEETTRPTFVRGDESADLPAEGRIWIDPDLGTVLRTEVRFDFEPGTAVVTTEYRPERPLAMWVPSEMKERYERLTATARYSNFRRFGVEVHEEAQVSEAPQ